MALTKVTGHVIKSDTNIISHNINSSGIITAVTFDGNVSGVAVTFTGDSTIGSLGITTNLTVGGNIDVDGHTDLDNVSISGVTTASDNVIIPDNKKLILGSVSGRQLHLYHNMVGSSNHVIESTSSSNHLIFKATTINPRSNYFSFRNYAHNQDVFTVDADGQTKLFFNGNTKLETTNTGAVVSGILTVTGNMNVEGVLTYQDVTNIDSIGIVTARDHINIVTDNKKLRIGAGQDLQIYHSTFNYIESHNDSEIHINANTGGSVENMAKFKPNGAVELYHNNQKKLETKGYGIDITGGFIASGGSIVNDGGNIKFGTGSDLQIFHDNSNNINVIQCHNGRTLHIDKDNGSENMAKFIPDGAVELYHNNVKKLETTTDGVTVTGAVRATGVNFPVGSTHLTFGHGGSFGELDNLTGNLRIKSGSINLANRYGNHNFIYCNASNSVDLYYDAANHSTPKLKTSATGITVDGEVAATQDYPNIRPVLDFNFAATKKLKPEMAFTRQGESSFHDGVGSVKFVSHNEPRFEHDILTGECKGLMFEGAGTNYSWHSRQFYSSGYPAGSWVPQNGGATPTITENTHTAPDGTSDGYYMADTISGATGTVFNGNVVKQEHTAGANVKHTFSIYIKLITATQATIYIRDGATGSTSSTNAVNTKTWQRVVVTSNNPLTNGTNHAFYIGNTNGTIAVWGSQIERSDYVTSYIKTVGGANGTRITDKGIHLDGEDVADIFNEGEGTLIAEVILTQSVSNNPIVGFYEDFASNNRLELRGDASSTGVARLEAVVGGSSVTSLTTNLQHSGVNNVSKYAYAFQLDNYAGCVNGGSVTTDTSSTFPSGINSMMIGEAVYQVDGAVIVKRIMYYPKRLPNSQLVTLTS